MASLNMDFKIVGFCPAVFTPFKESGDLDLEKIPAYCQFLIDHGTKYIFVNGSTGEMMSMSVQERKDVASKWLEVAKNRFSGIIVHVGANNLVESIELAEHAQRLGASAIAALPTVYFKPQSVAALVEYSRQVAQAAPNLPFYYYNNSQLSGVSFDMEDFLGEAKEVIPTLRGVKYSSTDLMDATQCVYMENQRFDIVTGVDELVLAAFVMGFTGAVGSTYNFMSSGMRRMMAASDAGDIVTARKFAVQSQRIIKAVANYGNLTGGMVGAFKEVMRLVGVDLGPPRLPMKMMDAERLEKMRADLFDCGFFDFADQMKL